MGVSASPNRLPLGILLIWSAATIGSSFQSISTDPNDVAFYLYPNPANWADKDVLTYGDAASVAASRFNPAKGLIVLIHGFAQNYTLVFPQVVKNVYLAANYAAYANILVVDWGKLATPTPDATLPWSNSTLSSTLKSALILLNYGESVSNGPLVAQRISDFLGFLLANHFLANLDRTHLIGMSLGAHVAGIAAADLRASTGFSTARITGLEPAGPGYQGVAKSARLDARDAVYVDVVHTNQGEFGYLGALGKADFFVNLGGPFQPGCDIIPSSVDQLFCSHGKSIAYFAQSIVDPTLQGCKCLIPGFVCPGPCTTFGEHSVPSASGSYFLKLVTP